MQVCECYSGCHLKYAASWIDSRSGPALNAGFLLPFRGWRVWSVAAAAAAVGRDPGIHAGRNICRSVFATITGWLSVKGSQANIAKKIGPDVHLCSDDQS